MNFRVGLGFDVHPFAAANSGRPLVLGGVTIDGSVGLDGHSDADAVAHAVADAILGVSGLGDLGSLYPSTDAAYRDADSIALLRDVALRVHERGWRVGNVDVVIAAERPKLAPHCASMAANVTAALAACADTDVFVSVASKRGEGLGFVGRAEGIAVWATALLAR